MVGTGLHRAAMAALLAGAAGLACGCAPATPTPRPSPSASATPEPSPTPPPTEAPDVHALQLTASGLGVYLETTVPVALVHNQSTRSYVSGASVHFDVVSPAGRVLMSVDEPVPPLGPGGDGVVAARLALSGNGNAVRARVSGGTWSATGRASPARQATVSCGGHACVSAHQPGVASVPGSAPLPGAFDAAALCVNGAGAVTGGGLETINATATTIIVPVILSGAAVSCQVTFSPAF
jgi:hypothetical protein